MVPFKSIVEASTLSSRACYIYMLLSLLRGLVLFGASRSLADLYLGDFYLDLADILADPDDSLL